jgi:hypothetical protein
MGGQRGVERGFGGVHVGADVLTIALVSTVVVPSGGVDAANSSRSRVISAECNARLAFSTCCRRVFWPGWAPCGPDRRRRRLPGSGGLEQADLPHREHLALAWPFGVEGDLGVGEPPGVDAAVLVGVAVLGEGVVVDVGGGALAPGQDVEPGRVRVVNSVGDQPPRSNPTSTRRSSPTMSRSSGINRRSSAASEAAGSAITTSSGSPAASDTRRRTALVTCLYPASLAVG